MKKLLFFLLLLSCFPDSLFADAPIANLNVSGTSQIASGTFDIQSGVVWTAKDGASINLKSISLPGSVATLQLTTPGAPTVTPTGTAGAATWSYKIVAVQPDGSTTAASGAGTTTTGNATLTGSNYNANSWSAVSGAYYYDVYRTTVGTSPSTTGKIARVTLATSYNDTGAAGDGTTAPTTNATGNITAAGKFIGSGAGLTSIPFSALPTGTGASNVAAGGVITAGGPIGDATHSAQITWNAAGQLTVVASIPISGGGGGSTTFITLADAPASYSGHKYQHVRVNSAESALEFAGNGGASPDDIPASPATQDDEFNAGSLDAKWTWVNQGIATTSFSYGRLLMTMAAEGSNNFHYIYQAVPGTDWTLTVKVYPSGAAATNPSSGIVLADSSGKLTDFFAGTKNTVVTELNKIGVTNWNSPSSFNSGFGTDQGWADRRNYLRVQQSGSNLIYSSSADGIHYITHGTQGKTSFLSSGPTRFGIFVNSNDASFGVTAVVDYFRVTTP
jgi:hypothetical protein